MAGVDGEVRLLRADTLAWLRDPRAVDEARALAGWARDRGLLRIELEALHRSADRRRPGTRPRGVDPEVLRRVRELAPLVDGPRAAAIVRHVQAQAVGDDDLVRIAERDLNRCGLWLPPVESDRVAHPPRAGDRLPRRRRPDQPRHRVAPHPVRPHRRLAPG